MATPLSFLMVKTGGFASPDFSGFAPCFMVDTLAKRGGETKRARRIGSAGTGGSEIQTSGLNSSMSGCSMNSPQANSYHLSVFLLLALMMSTPSSTSDEPAICNRAMLSCRNT